tara:strand:+ start:7137 stop:8558 length:1422 start_codon:yes stop_codon:yes gene_type:complete
MSIPDSIDYTSILPMAVESRTRRRGFVPSNGAVFISDRNNIVEIPVNASAFLDTKHSYLRFDLVNSTAQTLGLDYGGGHGCINRLRILQGGTVLSDCREYAKLLSSIILPVSANETNLATRSIKEGQRYANAGGAAGMAVAVAAEITGAAGNTPTNSNNSTAAAAAGSKYQICIPLLSGLIGTTQDKLIPLFLLNSSPLVIEITMSQTLDLGTYGGAAGVGWTMQDVRYMAALVETGPEVEEQVRMVQRESQGRLVLNGVDYTHHTGNIAANTIGRVSLALPVRKKSIKSVLFSGGTRAFAAPLQQNCYNLSYGGHMNMSEYQLSVGSRRIPEIPVGFQAFGGGSIGNKAQYFEELAKCFGETQSIHGLGVQTRINNSNQSGNNAGIAAPSAGGAACASHVFCPFGIDCEAFQPDGKGGGALESGVDTATHSTPMALNLDLGAGVAQAMVVDMYVVHDSLYFIDEVGNLRVSL